MVIECTGKFKSQELLAPYFDQGVKKVVVSAPVKDGTLNIVMGVNDHEYQDQAIVTAASCTTNCLAPVIDVLHKTFGIKHGAITTIHDITNTQCILDEYHSDLTQVARQQHVAYSHQHRLSNRDNGNLSRTKRPLKRLGRSRSSGQCLLNRLRF